MLHLEPIPDPNRLAARLAGLVPTEGFHASGIPGLNLVRVDCSCPRNPVSYEPSIVIVAQGRKIGHLADQSYFYDAARYLVLSVPLPFECEVAVRPGEPYLALSVTVDPLMVASLLTTMESPLDSGMAMPRCIDAAPLTPELIDAALRLVDCLDNPADARILGPQCLREIVYRVLCGPNGHLLRALVVQKGRFGQLAQVLQRIHTEYRRKLDVESLAESANMSVSAFHHAFKQMTATSPVQYLKSVRLHQARILLAQNGWNASLAAASVGYESASQFSREFKRMFGSSPRAVATRR